MNYVISSDQNASYDIRSGVTLNRTNTETNTFAFHRGKLPNNPENAASLKILEHKISSGPQEAAHVNIQKSYKKFGKKQKSKKILRICIRTRY